LVRKRKGETQYYTLTGRGGRLQGSKKKTNKFLQARRCTPRGRGRAVKDLKGLVLKKGGRLVEDRGAARNGKVDGSSAGQVDVKKYRWG